MQLGLTMKNLLHHAAMEPDLSGAVILLTRVGWRFEGGDGVYNDSAAAAVQWSCPGTSNAPGSYKHKGGLVFLMNCERK